MVYRDRLSYIQSVRCQSRSGPVHITCYRCHLRSSVIVISTTCPIFTVTELHSTTVSGRTQTEDSASSCAVSPNLIIRFGEIFVVELQVVNKCFMVTVRCKYRNISAITTLRLVCYFVLTTFSTKLE